MVRPPVTYQSIRDGSSIFPAAVISQFQGQSIFTEQAHQLVSLLLEEILVSAEFNYEETAQHIWTKYSVTLFIKINLLKVFKDHFKV